MSNEKQWAGEKFWGLGFEWDPQWLLTPAQKALERRPITLCESTLLGFESLDYWNRSVNERVLRNEAKQLDKAGKRALVEKLLGVEAAQKAA